MEKKNALPDPCEDRKVPTLPPPPNRELTSEELYPKTGKDKDKPDWKLLKDHMLKEGPVSKD
jgi:serine/threonine-protein phosphatase 2B catalytic subunit